MTGAIKLAIEALQNTIDCLMRENEKNDGPICDTIWYDDHTTLFDYINCELAALRAQHDHSDQHLAMVDHSELVKMLANLKCNSMTLSRNDENACNYMTASDWIDQNPKDFEDTPEDEIQAMRDTNTIWTLQIYPNTPIGSISWHGATMFSVLQQAELEGKAIGETK